METATEFILNGDRYAFDFKLCSASKGFAQVDTGQDAWYYGTWANPETLRIVNYCEGDLYVQDAASAAEFADAIREIKQWNEENDHGFAGIDGMCRDDLIARFQAIGLGDLLH